MKAILAVICLLFLAACAASNGVGPSDREGFVAAETDSTAHERAAPQAHPDLALSSKEEGDAALLISKLAGTPEIAARDKIISQLIGLGPRYLPFFRKVDSAEIEMDMLYVIHRIEAASGKTTAENATVANDDANKREGTAGEDGPKAPNYSPGEDFSREEAEKFMAARLKQAQTLLEGGRYDTAIRIAEAAIVLLPDSKWRPEFDALILRARGEGQSEMLIAGTLTLEPEVVQYASNQRGADFAEPLVIRCFLKNVSAQDITLRLYEGEGKESIVQLTVRYEQSDYQGNAMVQTGTVRLPVDSGGAITLAPNSSHEITVPLAGLSSLDADAPLKMALGLAQIEAALRVYGALDGEGNALVLRPIRFAKQTVKVFPSGFDVAKAQGKPLATLRELLKAGKAQEVYLCSQLVDARNLRAAGDLLLAEDFAQSPLPVQRARLRAMHTMFNTGATWDVRKWREWWADNRLRN